MIKFAIVNEAPKSLKKGEVVISKPDFLEEILANKGKAPKNNLTGTNQLRYITDTIAMKYDPQNMSAWSVKPHLFEGRPYSDEKALSGIIVEMLQICYPKVFARYVDHQIKNLPANTEMIYFVDFKVEGAAVPLFENGLINITDQSKSSKKQEKTNQEQVEE
jgi:hypothetical protein